LVDRHPSQRRRLRATVVVGLVVLAVVVALVVVALVQGPGTSPDDYDRLRAAYGEPDQVVGAPGGTQAELGGKYFNERWVWRLGEGDFEASPRRVAYLLDGVCVSIRTHYAEGLFSEEVFPWRI
jgi:hypothetical protein